VAGQGQHELFLTLFGVQRVKSGSIETTGKERAHRQPREAIRRAWRLSRRPQDGRSAAASLSRAKTWTLPILKLLSRWVLFIAAGELEAISRDGQAISIFAPRHGPASWRVERPAISRRSCRTLATQLTPAASLRDVTRGVDVATKHNLPAYQAAEQDGHTILFYSTDTEEMAHVCHRVLVMRERAIVAEMSSLKSRLKRFVAAADACSRPSRCRVPQ